MAREPGRAESCDWRDSCIQRVRREGLLSFKNRDNYADTKGRASVRRHSAIRCGDILDTQEGFHKPASLI